MSELEKHIFHVIEIVYFEAHKTTTNKRKKNINFILSPQDITEKKIVVHNVMVGDAVIKNDIDYLMIMVFLRTLPSHRRKNLREFHTLMTVYSSHSDPFQLIYALRKKNKLFFFHAQCFAFYFNNTMSFLFKEFIFRTIEYFHTSFHNAASKFIFQLFIYNSQLHFYASYVRKN